MSKESLLQRLWRPWADRRAQFRTGHLSKEDWRRMTESLEPFSAAPLWIDDAGSISVLEIGAKARRLKARQRIVDASGGLPPADHRAGRFGNRQEEVSSISRVEGLAKELQIPCWCSASSIARRNATSAGRSFRFARVRAPSSRMPTVVMFIYRRFLQGRDAPRERETELRIAKQQMDRPDLVKFASWQRFTRFEEAAPDRLLAICTRRHVNFLPQRGSLPALARRERDGRARGNSILRKGWPARFGTHLKRERRPRRGLS